MMNPKDNWETSPLARRIAARASLRHPPVRVEVKGSLHARTTAPFGELVIAVFDEAVHYSADPREVSYLAGLAVMDLVRRARKTSLLPMPQGTVLQSEEIERMNGKP